MYAITFKDSDEWVRKNYFPSREELWISSSHPKSNTNLDHLLRTSLSDTEEALINTIKDIENNK